MRNAYIILDDRPELKEIMRVMKSEGIITEWYNIGLELLDSDCGTLNVIKEDNPSKIESCCREMFNKWLQRNSDASWRHLTEALANVGLITAEKNISEGKCDRTSCMFLSRVKFSELYVAM